MVKRNPIHILFLLVLISATLSCSDDNLIELPQYFIRYYDKAEAVTMLRESDGWVLAGRGTEEESYIMHVDGIGNQTWRSQISNAQVQDMTRNSAKSIYSSVEFALLSDLNSPTASDLVILGYTSSGTSTGATGIRLDLTSVGLARCTTVIQGVQLSLDERDGLFLVVAKSQTCSGLIKPFILKMDGAANIVWLYDLGATDPAFDVNPIRSMIQEGAQLTMAYNVTDTLTSESSVRIARIDLDTGIESALGQIGGSTENITASEMIESPFGGYMVIGTRRASGTERMRLITVSAQGFEQQNSFIAPLTSSNRGHSVIPTEENGFMVGGSKQDFGSGDFVLLKTDQNGEKVWDQEEIIGGGDTNDFGTIVREINEGYVFFGTSEVLGLPRLTLVKTNRQGRLVD